MAGGASDSDGPISDINITPLVDIFLVLLIIFMVTATFFIEEQQRQKEIPLSLPKAYAGNDPAKEASPFNVIVDRAGRIFLNGQPSSLDGVGEAVKVRKASGAPPPDVVLSADKDLPYGQVTRVIDFLQLSGIGALAINVEEQAIWADGPK
jgi:biopolymer transport protein ExbD